MPKSREQITSFLPEQFTKCIPFFGTSREDWSEVEV